MPASARGHTLCLFSGYEEKRVTRPLSMVVWDGVTANAPAAASQRQNDAVAHDARSGWVGWTVGPKRGSAVVSDAQLLVLVVRVGVAVVVSSVAVAVLVVAVPVGDGTLLGVRAVATELFSVKGGGGGEDKYIQF